MTVNITVISVSLSLCLSLHFKLNSYVFRMHSLWTLGDDPTYSGRLLLRPQVGCKVLWQVWLSVCPLG